MCCLMCFSFPLDGLDSSTEGESSDHFASGALNGVVEGIRGALHKRFILEGESGLLADEVMKSISFVFFFLNFFHYKFFKTPAISVHG